MFARLQRSIVVEARHGVHVRWNTGRRRAILGQCRDAGMLRSLIFNTNIWSKRLSTVAPVACVAGAKIVFTLLEFNYAYPYGGAVRACKVHRS